jgi:hypothetical protein
MTDTYFFEVYVRCVFLLLARGAATKNRGFSDGGLSMEVL